MSERNLSGKNDPSHDDEEAQESITFTKHAYVEYWFSFAEQAQKWLKDQEQSLRAKCS
jgi:hypothetical protein